MAQNKPSSSWLEKAKGTQEIQNAKEKTEGEKRPKSAEAGKLGKMPPRPKLQKG